MANSATNFYLERLLMADDDRLKKIVCSVLGRLPTYDEIGKVADAIADKLEAKFERSTSAVKKTSKTVPETELGATLLSDMREEIDFREVGEALVFVVMFEFNRAVRAKQIQRGL